jgi:hypothetical protein
VHGLAALAAKGAEAQHGVIIPTDFQTVTTVEVDGTVKSTVNMTFMDSLTGKLVVPLEDEPRDVDHGTPGWTLDTGDQQLVLHEGVLEGYPALTSRYLDS